MTGVRPATMTETSMLRRTHELLSRLNLPPRTVLELDVSDTELTGGTPSPTPIRVSPLLSSSYSLLRSSVTDLSTAWSLEPSLTEEMRHRITKLTLLRLKEYMSLYPEYKFILIADSERGDAQLMLTSLFEELTKKRDEEEKKEEEENEQEKDKEKDEKENKKRKEKAKIFASRKQQSVAPLPIERASNVVRTVLVREVVGRPWSPLYKQMRGMIKERNAKNEKGKEKEGGGGKKKKKVGTKRLQVQGFKTFIGASLRAYKDKLLKFEGKDTLVAVSRSAVQEMQLLTFEPEQGNFTFSFSSFFSRS